MPKLFAKASIVNSLVISAFSQDNLSVKPELVENLSIATCIPDYPSNVYITEASDFYSDENGEYYIY